jgi:hypothetical protein
MKIFKLYFILLKYQMSIFKENKDIDNIFIKYVIHSIFINSCFDKFIFINIFLINKYYYKLLSEFIDFLNFSYEGFIIYKTNKYDIIHMLFILSCEYGNLNITKYICENYNIDIYYNDDYAIFETIFHKNIHIFKYLLEKSLYKINFNKIYKTYEHYLYWVIDSKIIYEIKNIYISKNIEIPNIIIRIDNN